MATALEAALRRHRAISIAALAVLTIAAWAWLFAGAGMAMKPLVSLAPVSDIHEQAAGMAMDMPMRLPWSAGYFALVASMWWVMMVAMMLPSAAPMILLFSRAAAHSVPGARPATGSFLAGYLLVWGAFSFAAALLQDILEQAGLLAPMTMALRGSLLSAAVLISAGIYQLSPLKNACLRHCRNPAGFLSSHYRPGAIGALRMGFIHGTYCVGCCWLLMALLFVGGVMNLAWIALLAIMVAAEKLLPFGRHLTIAAGVACIAWGLSILLF